MSLISKIQKNNSYLKIIWNDGEESKFNYMWLRDNCPTAHDKDSRHRMFNILEVSQEINPKNYSINNDGKLEITDFDELGFGSGTDRLEESLENNFDDVASIFTDPDDGIAKNLYDYIREFTQSGGLLRTREQNAKDEKTNLEDERANFELQMLSFEQIQRDKYLALDQTVSQLNRTGNALIASLGSI